METVLDHVVDTAAAGSAGASRCAHYLADRLAAFALDTRYEDLPAEVILEAKRRLLDTIGCTVGAIDEPAPRIATCGLETLRRSVGHPDWRRPVGTRLGRVCQRHAYPVPRLQ